MFLIKQCLTKCLLCIPLHLISQGTARLLRYFLDSLITFSSPAPFLAGFLLARLQSNQDCVGYLLGIERN